MNKNRKIKAHSVSFFWCHAVCATLLFVCSAPVLFAENLAVQSSLNDGPYVTEQGSTRLVVWICDGNKEITTVGTGVPSNIEQCGQQATLGRSDPSDVKQFEYMGDFKVAAVSDVHG